MNEVERIAQQVCEIIEGSGESAAEIMAEIARLIEVVNAWRRDNGVAEI